MARLRSILEDACAKLGCSLNALTVLSNQRDPFRVDTPANHRDGSWLAEQAGRHGLGERKIHLRGLHYLLLSAEAVKPNGLPYTNTDTDWEWMSEDCAKAARWLGYIPFDQIVDARNSPPTVITQEELPLRPYVTVGVEVTIPDADALE